MSSGMRDGLDIDNYTEILFLEAKLFSKEDEFEKLADPSDIVNLVYNYINKLKAFQDIIAETQNRKSNIISEKLRMTGNSYFSNINYLSALEKYTESIASAENGSSYLALAYANRSACLFKEKYYKECLEDIDRALSLDYPENLKPKLLKRKTDAESQKHMQKQFRYYSKPPEIESKHPLIPCAADSIEMQCNKKYGRHIIATRDIDIGEVLSVENSFCHVASPESKYMHCHECLELCLNMIPCENCSIALYCSEDCRSKSFEVYHKYECQFPKILLDMIFIKIAIIGMDDSKKTKAELPNDIHRCDSFKEIIKLEMHYEEIDNINLSKVAIFASIAYHVLKENQEFASKYDTDEDDMNLKKLLFKASMIIRFNPFSIIKICNGPLNKLQSKEVGTALYAFNSLFNHSCMSNSAFFFHGSQIVIRTKASIKKGEQITIPYVTSFEETPKATRQKKLKEGYMFDCDCKACTNNWATVENLPRGKDLPLSFAAKLSQKIFDGSEWNQNLINELLTYCKRLYYQLEKYEPCSNLLFVQETFVRIYRYQSCRDVDFNFDPIFYKKLPISIKNIF